jgi:hypothetical protein
MDMSDALHDPDMGDFVTVKRRVEAVSTATGRSSTTDESIPNVFGVIAEASKNDLERLPEADRMGRNMSMVTSFALRGPAQVEGTQFKPDIVVWRGNEYLVKQVGPYPQFGPGFIQAIMGSVEIIETVGA